MIIRQTTEKDIIHNKLKKEKKMEKTIRGFIVALITLAVLNINIGIVYTLFTDFYWIGLLYTPTGLLMWSLPYLVYKFLSD